MRTHIGLAVCLAVVAPHAHAQELSAADLMAKVGAYAASYGEKSSVVVAQETSTQNVTVEGAPNAAVRPIELVAEFAIVKVQGGGWTGFRDVIKVNGEPVPDRKDRLATLLNSPSASMSEATRIANESARYNVGPISRNINTPTAALFFFLPQNLERFAFTKKGSKTIDGVKTTEIAYKETKLPTLITTRSGRNVPLEGSLWVMDDGTVVRTRMRVERFADADAPPVQQAPGTPAPTAVASNNGGREAVQAAGARVPLMETRPIESSADIEVTYKKPADIDLWLPAQMTELYEGPIQGSRLRLTSGQSHTRAKYSNYKQFGASGKIVPQ